MPAANTFGNAGRTDGYGPGLISMDLSMLKEFRLTAERHRLQFRLEILNFPNHANFGNPIVSQGNAALRPDHLAIRGQSVADRAVGPALQVLAIRGREERTGRIET